MQVSPGWAGWVAAGATATLICTVLPIDQYFETLEFSLFIPLSLISAACFHSAVHVSHQCSKLCLIARAWLVRHPLKCLLFAMEFAGLSVFPLQRAADSNDCCSLLVLLISCRCSSRCGIAQMAR